MRIAVYGVGGVGGYFGGRLAHAGENVTFIARGAQLQALQTNGLRVESVQGDFVVDRVNVTDDPQRVGAVDVVLVAVKAWQVPAVAEAMRPLVGPQTLIVPLQNGVEAPTQLASVLGASHVVGGVCGLVSYIVAPGHIRHAASAPFVQVGDLDARPIARLDALGDAFERAGVRFESVADIQCAMWMKFIFITTWSGLGALTRAPIGVWRSQPETRRLSEQAALETLAVAHARGVAVPEDAMDRTFTMLDNVPVGGTSSMQRDVMAGRPSELEAQSGAVVRLGAEAGVATPLHSFIYSSLLPQERRARGEAPFEL